MNLTSSTAPSYEDARRRIIVALDVDSEQDALHIARELRDSIGAVKIGLQLFTAGGPQLVRRMVDDGIKVFLDLKFHDIPNTVSAASVEAAKLGVWMFNVHASGGSEMMRLTMDRITELCERQDLERPIVIGVTVLTSSDAASQAELGISESVPAGVARLSRLAANAGLDGVVASAKEVGSIRDAVTDKKFLIVTPGIRSISSATVDDQKRVTTLRAALSAGSDYVVIGRPITGSSDRLGAIERLLEETE